MLPMAEMVIPEASMREELSSRCPASVEGIVPSSCPLTLSVRRAQKVRSVSTPASNSSRVQKAVGSFST